MRSSKLAAALEEKRRSKAHEARLSQASTGVMIQHDVSKIEQGTAGHYRKRDIMFCFPLRCNPITQCIAHVHISMSASPKKAFHSINKSTIPSLLRHLSLPLPDPGISAR